MMTVEQAQDHPIGATYYHNTWRNADGTPERWRRNGAGKSWKRTPDRIEIPLKRGLWEFSYLTNGRLGEFSLTERQAMGD